ncbi:MAG: PQQ-binding-like beta-propeller repeat protein [Candidatus Bathyarchaeota archaeon]|nr:PQQ-binding-like beta-propeller repeat protein [Candidatus Bathyarchaeota archaeon]
MKSTLKKTKFLFTVSLLALTITLAFLSMPISYAHVPAWKIPTYSYITATPNPVGVGQTVTLAFWLDKLPPTAAGYGGDRWRNLKVEITKPGGSKDVIGPVDSDPVGCGYALYTPSEVGTYTFLFIFPGQTLSRYGPTGIVGSASDYENDTYLPSNATATLTVQEEPIPQPPTYPLPKEYWTRPIEGQNNQWYTVASNWLAGAHEIQKVQPDGTAPNTPHIMWTRPMRDGGVVGGTNTRENGTTYYDGTQYEGQFQNPLAMYGRLYYTVPLGSTGGNGGYVCVDIRTGKTIWSSDVIGTSAATAPSFGQLYAYDSMNQHGMVPNGYLWTANFANAYDPLTGKLLFNMTSVPSGTEVYGPNGEILRYVLNVSGNWLACWNNTAGHALTGSTVDTDFTSTSYNQWRPIGKSVNMSDAYSWNVTIPALPAGSTIRQAIFDDILLGSAGTFGGVSEINPGYTMWAISLKPQSRGTLLWTKTYAAPAGNLTRSFRFIDPINRVFIFWDKETITYSAYNLDNGEYLWTTPSENPWNLYANGGGSIWTQTTAYGKLYSTGYSGIVYCYDTKTGKQLWNYSTAKMAGFSTPYGGYPLGVVAVADGKIYFHTNEHSSGAPYWKGSPMICLNATTGEEIWTIPFHGSSGYVPWGYVVADGYLVGLNLFDEQLYCFGKGPTATTLNAPDTSILLGRSLVIKGTVTDISSGTQQPEQAARFPNGVPAVSDNSMSAWMQYVYQQKPRPTNTTGVSVKLSVIDSNNNYREIGTVTTNDDGFFSLTWTPDIPGSYTVYANFEGSESYWPSHAVTSFAVDDAPATSSPYPQITLPPTENYIIGVGIAIIVAIVIGFAITILMLRKRP